MATDARDDLVILAADQGIHKTIDALLRRFNELEIPKLKYQILSQHERDSKTFNHAQDTLRPFSRLFRYALVLFDRKDCGKGRWPRETIERDVEERLFRNGWPNRAVALALDPELEIWVWSDSLEVDRALGWEGKTPPLRQWLVNQNFIDTPNEKPSDPKEAFKKALDAVGKKTSSSIFQQIASSVSLNRCADPAFLKLKATLHTWFADETIV